MGRVTFEASPRSLQKEGQAQRPTAIVSVSRRAGSMGLDSRNATENPRISSSKKGLIRADPDPHSPRTYLLAAF